MTEQLFNAYESTVGAPYTAGDPTLTVASASVPGGGTLPLVGLYTVTVRDSVTGAVKAIFTVLSRTALVLTLGTPELDANCAIGDTVSGYTLSNRSLLACLEGPILSPPDSSLFAWQNQNGASLFSDAAGFSISVPSNGGNNVTQRVMALTQPYTIICGFRVTQSVNNFSQGGPTIRESGTGHFITWRWSNLGAGQFDIFLWSGDSSPVSTYTAQAWVLDGAPLVMVKIQADATHRTWSIGDLRQRAFTQVLQQAVNTDITEDQFGFFGLSNSGVAVVASLEHLVIS